MEWGGRWEGPPPVGIKLLIVVFNNPAYAYGHRWVLTRSLRTWLTSSRPVRNRLHIVVVQSPAYAHGHR